jgi:hypothetical protein
MISLNGSHRVGRFCADEPLASLSIDHARYFGEKRMLVATDGASIITVPVEGKTESPATYDHPEAAFDPKHLAKINGKPVEVAGFKMSHGGKATDPATIKGFPNWASLFDSSPPEKLFALSVDQLAKIVEHARDTKASVIYLGASGFNQEIGDTKAVTDKAVKFCYAPESETVNPTKVVSGLVSPCKITDEKFVGAMLAAAFDPERNVDPKATAGKPVKMVKRPPLTSGPPPSVKTAPKSSKGQATPPATAGKPMDAAKLVEKELKAIKPYVRDAAMQIAIREFKPARKNLEAAAKLATTSAAKQAVAKLAKLLK